MIIDQVLPLLPRLECTTAAKRRSEVNCVNVDMCVDKNERYIPSKISNKLVNKIILEPMPCKENSILDITTKRTNYFSKNIDHLEIEPIHIELTKSCKTTNVVVVKDHVKEKEVVTSKIKLSDIYGVFPIDFSPLVLMKMMIGNKPRNAIVYNFPFLIKTPYIMCLTNGTLRVQLTNLDINRLKKPCACVIIL